MLGFDIVRRLCAVPLAAALTAWPAAAVERTPADVAAWVAANTDIAPSQVVHITPEHVYGLELLGPRGAAGEAVGLVRTEAFAATGGVQSWEAHLLLDCRVRRVRLIRSAAFSQRNRQGEPSATAEVGAWLSPLPEQPANALLAAACDAGYVWPLRAQVARSTPSPEAPVAAPATADASYAVQLARGPSADGAQRAIRAARKALGPAAAAYAGSLEHSKIGVLDRYTAVLGGFPSETAADAACDTLRAAGQDCFVRAQAAEVATPAAPSAPSPGYAVQLAYGPSEEGAVLAVRRARKALGRQTAALKPIYEASADGARHTALLTGFETAGAAARACETLRKAELECFARPAPVAPMELAAQ